MAENASKTVVFIHGAWMVPCVMGQFSQIFRGRRFHDPCPGVALYRQRAARGIAAQSAGRARRLEHQGDRRSLSELHREPAGKAAHRRPFLRWTVHAAFARPRLRLGRCGNRSRADRLGAARRQLPLRGCAGAVALAGLGIAVHAIARGFRQLLRQCRTGGHSERRLRQARRSDLGPDFL